MSKPAGDEIALPKWAIVAASVAIVFHVSAVGLSAMASWSGPWITPDGATNMYMPPQFAQVLMNSRVSPYYYYEKGVKMPFAYRFVTNRPNRPGVAIKARLRDADGREIAVVEFPQDRSNCWVRYRQGVFAYTIGEDINFPPPQGELIAPVGKEATKVTLWRMDDMNHWSLVEIPEHLVPRNEGILARPSDMSQILARSLARYLCREYNASSAEIIRGHRNPIAPAVLFEDAPAGLFQEINANFGELTK